MIRIMDSPRIEILIHQMSSNLDDELPILVNVDEYSTFKTDKRRIEHRAGRIALAEALENWGLASSQLEVIRDNNRAPSLKWIQGVFKNQALPAISIGHAEGYAFIALIEPGWWVGIDGESKARGIAENAFAEFCKDDELHWLKANPSEAIRLWTSKEAVQKAMHLGMSLNPRNIIISRPKSNQDISIEGMKIQLESFQQENFQIGLAWRVAGSQLRSQEDDLLDATREAMRDEAGNLIFDISCQVKRAGG